jgi:RNA-directed DNA polymerase
MDAIAEAGLQVWLATERQVEVSIGCLWNRLQRLKLPLKNLRGRISWVGHIKGPSDPIFRGLASRYNKVFPSEKLEILPTIFEIRERTVWVVEHWGDDAAEGSAQGTAFFLKSIGLVTAWHPVEGATEIAVYHPSKPSNKFKVTVAKNDAHRDLAVLAHEISATEYYELDISKRTFRVGDNTTALGFPSFGPSDKINVRSGLITSLPMKSAVPMIEVAQKLSQACLEVHCSMRTARFLE